MKIFCVFRLFLATIIITGSFALSSSSSHATEIQKVVSPGGITAWLVEQHSVPVIALRAGFKGGSASDPQDRQGLANLTSATMDEGAGKLDSQAFQRRLEELAISLSFSAGRDEFYGSMKTLSEYRDEAFEMLRMALIEPRFDNEPVQRIRRQIIAGLKREEHDPDTQAYRHWFERAFKGHAYGRYKKGTIEGLKAITPEDLRGFVKKLLSRDVLRISVVGDIDAKTLAPLLDKTFGELPEKTSLAPIEETAISDVADTHLIKMDIPQSVIVFGMNGIKRTDDDFIPAYIMNYILGGGGFSSRLTEEVREKRGLTYSVYSFLMPFSHAGVFMGSASTKNSSVKEALDLIIKEIERMASKGVSKKELKAAKTYLTGSYPLRFDSNSKIARQLIGIQMEELGIDYINKRNGLIEAVTAEDIARVAKRLLKPGAMKVVIVGQPDGIE